MILLILGILGAAMGSFVDALAWRLHEGKNFVTGRSECEHCGHMLQAGDLIPIVSWLMTKGTCRYCHKKLSWRYPVIELIMATLFIFSYIFWPQPLENWQAWASFVIWLTYLVALGALVIYDFRWMLLPDVIVFPLIGLGFVDVLLRFSLQPWDSTVVLQHIVLGIASLGGVYWLLYRVSKGKWVGFGDVKLGIFIGLVLGWPYAFLALFLANLIGFLVVIPGVVTGKLTTKTRIPFGPFLVLAFILAGLFGADILAWYLHIAFFPLY